jgi:hypothetical protein
MYKNSLSVLVLILWYLLRSNIIYVVISGRTRRRSSPPWICIERLLHLLPDRGGVQWCLPLAFAGEEHKGDVTADHLCLLV